MATDIERLVVQLSADVKQYQNALNKAMGVTNQRTRAIESRFARMNKGIAAGFSALGRGITAAFAVAGTVKGAQTLLDSATRINNALKIAGLSGADLEKVYGRLRNSAVKNAAPLETLVTLYGRAALVQKELGVSQEEMLNFTDKIALALRVSGQSAAESSGALLQLSQALGSGTVRAEEFNSILEGALPIAQAAAAGLKEAGGSVAQLRQLVVDGEISSEAFFRAFEAGAVILEDKVAEATFTVSQATGNLWTALIDVAREFEKSTGAAENFAGGINGAAQAITDFDVSELISKIGGIRKALDDAAESFGNAGIWGRLNELMGVTDAEGNVFNPDVSAAETKIAGLEREVELLQQQIELNSDLGFDNTEAIARIGEVRSELAKLRADAANLPATVGYTIGDGGLQQTSAGDFRVPFSPLTGVPTELRGKVKTRSLSEFSPPPKRGGRGSGRGGRGGGGRGNDYQREVEQIKERTAALQAETAAQAGINPLIDDYDYTITKAKATQELLNAAQKAGIEITPALRASIDQLAEGYANATVESNRLAESQDQLRKNADEIRGLGKDVMSGFISDLRSGASASEALSNALNKVLDKLIDIGLESIFSGKGGLFGGGGLLGGAIIPGILHSGGVAGSDGYGHGRAVSPSTFAGAKRYHTGGVAGLQPGEVPAILQRGEVVLPRGTKMGGQQGIHVTVGVSADNNGNLMPFVESVSQGQVKKAAPSIVSAATQRVVPTMAKYQTEKAGGDWR